MIANQYGPLLGGGGTLINDPPLRLSGFSPCVHCYCDEERRGAKKRVHQKCCKCEDVLPLKRKETAK